MPQNLLDLTKKFISIRSTEDNKEALNKILETALSLLSGFTIERFEHRGVRSALVYVAKKRPRKFKILLNAHLDVIPGKTGQFIPKIKGRKIFGTGSMDMKAGAAAMISAFRDTAREVSYPLGLQLVTDEEVGGFNGARYQVEKGVRADFVIAGEPTNFDIVHKAKGVLWLEVTLRGKTAHSAYPWRGQNAIVQGYSFLRALEKIYPSIKKEAWVTTVNVSRIQTENTAFNKIPDSCVVSLDVRFTEKTADDVLRKIKKIIPDRAVVKVLAKESPLSTEKGNNHLALLADVSSKRLKEKIILRGANGSSDARHFAAVGGAGVEFGPRGGDIGGDTEWVDIPSIDLYAQILNEFLREVR